MIFSTRVNGIPCKCRVDNYSPGVPMRIYGSGMGDADPPEPPEFEFTILDRTGYEAPWLQKYVTDSVEARLYEEFMLWLQEDYYMPY